jgi:hypothetical protein
MNHIRITLDVELTDDRQRPLSPSQLQDAADDADAAIRNRLFGEGFLPADILVYHYDIRAEVVQSCPQL